MSERARFVRGCLLGTAVGDAVGLAREGLSARRGARLFPGEPRPQLLPGGRGLISDDTEHACIAAQAFVESGGDVERFRRALGRRLRWWFASLPPGVGMATVRACLKLWVGVSPARSGVGSAGNGPLMRAPVLGVLGRDLGHVRELVTASTLVTHTDERAVEGALIAAALAHVVSRSPGCGDEVLIEAARGMRVGGGTESLAAVERAFAADVGAVSAKEFVVGECGGREKAKSGKRKTEMEAGEERGVAEERGGRGDEEVWGVSGYVVRTLGCSVYAWRRHRADARAGVGAIVLCGGDTDSTGALVGGLYGAEGVEMPDDWLRGVRDWPRSVGWIERLGAQAVGCSESGAGERALGTPVGACLVRNVGLLGLVVAHVGRRALPPY